MLGGVGISSALTSALAYGGMASAAKVSPTAAQPLVEKDSAVVSLSAAGKAAAAAAAERGDPGPTESTASSPSSGSESVSKTRGAGGTKATTTQLSPDELKQVESLKARDRIVRAHEQAHQAAAGGLATSGASYTYQRGPDGVNYAIGGEVSISLSEGRTPEATIDNAQAVRAAALAPSDPSPQDRAVAAAASQLEARARAELVAQKAAPTESGATSSSRDPGIPANALASEKPRPGDSDRDAQTERTRTRVDDIYGQIANLASRNANATGFSARA